MPLSNGRGYYQCKVCDRQFVRCVSKEYGVEYLDVTINYTSKLSMAPAHDCQNNLSRLKHWAQPREGVE
jgi:hypothetical protein